MNRYACILLVVLLSAHSACEVKQKTYVNPCGDPPPVAEMPALRIIDKATGKDYFIQNPDKLNNLAITRNCTLQTPVVSYNQLSANNKLYGYAIGFSYLPLQSTADSCKKMIFIWDGKDRDILVYYIHMGTCVAILDSLYYNGNKLQQVPDSMPSPVKSYYTIIK